MSKRVVDLYFDARKAGYPAAHALSTAKTVNEFSERGDVRIEMFPEFDGYFDVHGEPDGYVDGYGRRVSAEEERKQIEESIENLGCWIVAGQILVDEDNPDDEKAWETIDSVGMNTGYSNPCSWRENWYVPDLMDAVLRAAKDREAAIGEYSTQIAA